MQALTCPLCGREVAVASSGCRVCHLPMSDVVRRRGGRRTAAEAVGLRLTGLVLYTALVAWCYYQLPDTVPFVVPAAVLGGGVLHVWKGRPWLGLLLFGIVAVLVPALVMPSMLTGQLSDAFSGW